MGKDDKPRVSIDSVSVTKSFDKAAGKAAVAAACTAMAKALAGGKLAVVKSVKKSETGFGVQVTIVEIAHDPAKKTITMKIAVAMTIKPGPRIIRASGSESSGTLPDANPRKLPADAAYLAREIVKKLGPKVRKALEAQAAKA